MSSLDALSEAAAELKRRTDTALGKTSPDVILAGGRVLLPSGEILPRDVAIRGRHIAAVAEGITAPGARTVRVDGKFLVPGYVEPHAHTLGPLSVDTYLGEALARGTTCVVSDDSYAYTFLDRGQYEQFLDYSALAPIVFEWSMRTDVGARTITWAELLGFLDRPDVRQVGEVITGKLLDPFDDDLAELLAKARSQGRRIEGHCPGASLVTLGSAAAAGVGADHEAVLGREAVDRLRLGIWALLRYNRLRPDVPGLIEYLLADGAPLNRTAFTIDGATPAWIRNEGMIDAAISAAIGAGLEPAKAYQLATIQPASYLRLDQWVGMLAPGRLANVNVLDDLEEPRPGTVFNYGREAVRDGVLQAEVTPVPWSAIGAPRWSRHDRGPARGAYVLGADDPVVHLESQAMVRLGPADGPALTCVTIDPVGDRYTRSRFHGFPGGLRAVVSTLTPERLLVAIGSDPAALEQSVNTVYAAGGGLAFHDEAGLQLLPLPVGGVVTGASFDTVSRFWLAFEAHLHELGHRLPDPAMTLLFIPTDALPGARFVADGLIDTRTRQVLRRSTPIAR